MMQMLNRRKNQANVASSLAIYRSRMAALVAPDLAALHPQQLLQEHNEAIEFACNEFYSKRIVGEDIEEVDEYRDSIVEVIRDYLLSKWSFAKLIYQ